MRGLDYRTVTVPLVAGLNQKADPRAIKPPELVRAVDVQFDEVGGLQNRKPFAAIGNEIQTGGAMTDERRLVEYGNEMLCFTKDSLYSRSEQDSTWVLKGTHLAVKLDERNVFATGRQQTECDRAELDDVILYAWTETDSVWLGALDKTTGAVIMPAFEIASSSSRPRVIALSTKFLLLYSDSGVGLTAAAIATSDISSSGVSVSTTVVLATPAFDTNYDATRIIGADSAVVVAMRNPDTSYTIAKVTSALAVTTSTKARNCDGPIAVACHPSGTFFQVARTYFGATAIRGDYIDASSLADVNTNQAIGTANNSAVQVTAAYRSTADGGQYRCYVFWSDGTRTTSGSTSWRTWVNWVDTGNSVGSETSFLRRLDIGSRAFDHDGDVYVWMVWGNAAGSYGWGGELQNASFLYRDDGFLVAKSAWNRGGGFLTSGHLPGVASTDTNEYSYAGTDRAVIGGELTSSNFTGKRPRDVVFTFDSDEARRCVQIGRTLYVACGEGLLQYDGVTLTECGFHVWPWYYVLSIVNGGGSLENGEYAYKLSYASSNAQAERDRSAAIYTQTAEVTSGPDQARLADIVPLYVTHKDVANLEIWRTQKDPTDESPYYLATSNDPSDTSNPNPHILNDTTLSDFPNVDDYLIDADLAEFGTNPQDVELPSLAPPACTLIAATDSRIFLAGVGGDPHAVWYSKQRRADEVVAFHGALRVEIPAAGGDITALAHLNETLVVFRETAVYVVPGDGFDNAGNGTNYGPTRSVPGGIGAVNQESVCATDRGLIFKSSKGWYLLNRGFALEYIGGPVSDYDDETPLAAHLVEAQHQVRILTASRMLVLDTLVGQWAEWSIDDGVHAAIWNGTYHYTTGSTPKSEQPNYTFADYGWDIEFGWIPLSDLIGFARLEQIQLRGEYRSAGELQWRLARDDWKDGVDTYFQDKTWTPSPTTVGGQLRVKHGPSIQQMESLRLRLTWTPTTVGEAPKLTALAFRIGFDPQLTRLPAAQRQ